jgi:pyroglutamyl-peptidase
LRTSDDENDCGDGFSPFLSHAINPSEQAARALDGHRFGDFVVKGIVLPVSFKDMPGILAEILSTHPHAVVLTGLAADRKKISFEKVAINLIDSSGRPDNDGAIIQDQLIDKAGENAYFSSLPIRQMYEQLSAKQIASEISLSAGSYVCNQSFYLLMNAISRGKLKTLGGFIHLPASADLGGDWKQEEITHALRESLKEFI